jgi:hypothetical protein
MFTACIDYTSAWCAGDFFILKIPHDPLQGKSKIIVMIMIWIIL